MEAVNEHLKSIPILPALLDSVPVIILVLDNDRRVCLANLAAEELGKERGRDTVLSLRPGDVVGCVHASEKESGCGTTEFCRVCGAAIAINSAKHGQVAVQECRIITADGGARDLRVWARPLEVDGVCKTLFSATDITDDKRRRVLERLFFHDVVNAVAAVQGTAEIMKDASGEQKDELSEIIALGARQALEVIASQRQLAAAEAGELVVNNEEISSISLLEDIKAIYEISEQSKDGVYKLHRNPVTFDFFLTAP